MDPAAGDFSLGEGSPMIDRGVVVPGITDGFAGVAPDLGAYERGASERPGPRVTPGPAPCVPDCTGRVCGPDPACGVSCGTCAGGEACDSAGGCPAGCVPHCAGRVCGPDPVCGASCGECAADATCSTAGACLPAGSPDEGGLAGGCGCRTPGHGGVGPLALLLLVGLAGRRRRR